MGVFLGRSSGIATFPRRSGNAGAIKMAVSPYDDDDVLGDADITVIIVQNFADRGREADFIMIAIRVRKRGPRSAVCLLF